MKYILALLLLINTCSAQTLYVADNMENPNNGWRGVSTTGINSGFTGGLSAATDNPASTAMYASSDSCYITRGNGTGSSSVEVDTFIYPSVNLTSGNTYQIRFKVASIGVSPSTNASAGLDGTDWIELQYMVDNNGSWYRDAQIQGNSNAVWTFNGAVGTNAKTDVTRTGSTSTTLFTSYTSTSANPVVNMWVTLPSTSYTSVKIRFISRANASGETILLDDVEIWETVNSLPVQLISFTGKCNKENIELEWVTVSELNNDRFEIYKSYDGINYEWYTQAPGHGTTSQIFTYSTEDKDTSFRAIYYKLVQIDYDGKITNYDPIIVYNNCKKKTSRKVYNILGQEVNEDYLGTKFYK